MVGGFLAALCCLGVPAVVSFLGAIGAGFLVDDRIMVPALVAMLGAALWGLGWGRRRVHGRRGPETIGWAGAIVLVAGLRFGGVVVATGTALMLIASAQNVRARKAGAAGGAAPARDE
ncbi:MAG: MerC family mercury resistance protein [Myxococcota bacterium]